MFHFKHVEQKHVDGNVMNRISNLVKIVYFITNREIGLFPMNRV